MAKRKRSKAARPIILQIPPPSGSPRRRNPGTVGAALINPARDASGRYLPRSGRRRRTRNPASLAGLVNPSPPMVTYVGAPIRRRRPRRSNPLQIGGTSLTVKGVAPIAVGAGLGVVGATLSAKYLSPHVRPAIQGAIEIGAGLLGATALNRVYKGSGIYFAGFMVGTGLSRIIIPLLPWGDLDSVEEPIDGYDDVEVIGDGLGDLGDDGIEDVMIDDDGGAHLTDALGVLPPFPVPMPPRPLLGLLRRRRMLWLLRMGIPHSDLESIFQRPPVERRRALRHLRQLYLSKRGQISQASPPRYASHPAVQAHPARRPQRGGTIRAGKVRQVARPRGRGGKFGDVYGGDPEIEAVNF